MAGRIRPTLVFLPHHRARRDPGTRSRGGSLRSRTPGCSHSPRGSLPSPGSLGPRGTRELRRPTGFRRGGGGVSGSARPRPSAGLPLPPLRTRPRYPACAGGGGSGGGEMAMEAGAGAGAGASGWSCPGPGQSAPPSPSPLRSPSFSISPPPRPPRPLPSATPHLDGRSLPSSLPPAPHPGPVSIFSRLGLPHTGRILLLAFPALSLLSL